MEILKMLQSIQKELCDPAKSIEDKENLKEFAIELFKASKECNDRASNTLDKLINSMPEVSITSNLFKGIN
jgi:hypothetical protein